MATPGERCTWHHATPRWRVFELRDTCGEIGGARRVLISDWRQPGAAFQAFPCCKQEPLPGASVSVGGRHLLEPYFRLISSFCPCLPPEILWKPLCFSVRLGRIDFQRASHAVLPYPAADSTTLKVGAHCVTGGCLLTRQS